MFLKEIEDIRKEKAAIQNELKYLGLENVMVGNFIQNDKSEVRKYQLQIEHCDIKSKISKMEIQITKLKEEIDKSKKNIKKLTECLKGKINVDEINTASERRKMMVQKLLTRQFSDQHLILQAVFNLKELEEISKK